MSEPEDDYDRLRQAFEDLTEASQVERAAALVTIKDQATEIANLKREADVYWRAGLKSSDQHIEAERTIEELQRRIEELGTQLKGSSAGMPQTWSGNSWMVEGIADPSEPETG